ncbi:hypothetical protein CR513_23062, partial [Mucuna pruriens]
MYPASIKGLNVQRCSQGSIEELNVYRRGRINRPKEAYYPKDIQISTKDSPSNMRSQHPKDSSNVHRRKKEEYAEIKTATFNPNSTTSHAQATFKFLRITRIGIPGERPQVTTLIASKDLKKLSMEELLGILKVHEIELKKDEGQRK